MKINTLKGKIGKKVPRSANKKVSGGKVKERTKWNANPDT